MEAFAIKMTDGRLELKSEFSCVEIVFDTTANGPRLRVTDLARGVTRFLDPLQLECLTRLPPEVLDRALPY